jgi:hypothetical protein
MKEYIKEYINVSEGWMTEQETNRSMKGQMN